MDRPTTPSPRYIAILAFASGCILLVGWFARPREIPQSPPPLPSESELAQLARRAERRALDSMTSYFAGTADQVESSIVYLPQLAASGVVWDAGVMVTAPFEAQRMEGPVALNWAGGSIAAQPRTWGPLLPLATVMTSSELPGLLAASRAPSPPGAGSWILAVWRTDRGRAFAAGTYLQTAPALCGEDPVREVLSNVPLHEAMAGGGVFDIDGGLLAVILRCNGRLAAIATSSVAAILAAADTLEERVRARHGLGLGSLSADELAFFGVDAGVIVREVWTGYTGDESGVTAGDIITELNGAPVTSLNDLLALTTPSGDGGATLQVRRGAKVLALTLSHHREPAPATAPDQPSAGVVLQTPRRSFPVDSVEPGSRAAEAGIEPGDRIVRVNHVEPRSLAEIQRVFGATRRSPLLVEVERDDRRLAILVP